MAGAPIPIRSSAWTTPVSVVIPSFASVTSLELVLVSSLGFVLISSFDNSWQLVVNVATSSATGGVRLYYAQKAYDGTDPNFLSYIDVKAIPGVIQHITIPMIAKQFQTQFVDAVPSLGWDAVNSTVSGAFGARVRAVHTRYDSASPVMPMARVTTIETTSQGTLILDVSDPQGRVTSVQMESQSGNGAWNGWAPPAETASPYKGYVSLTPKQPSKIAYRVWGADVTGIITILAQDLITFSVGGAPLAPVLREFVDTAGNIQVSWMGDSDTNNTKIAASIIDYPTAAVVRATSALPGASGLSGVLLTAQVGMLIYVSAFAYNADGLESPMTQYKVHYLGIGTTPLPDIVIGTPISESTRVRFPFSWDSQTTDIDAWYEVFLTGAQPATARSSIRAPGAVALPSISVSEGVTEIAVPLVNATDYGMLTLVGRDPLNQKGAPQFKMAQGASPAAPAGPTAASNIALTSSTVTNSVTTPAAALVTWKIRTKKNGVVFGFVGDTPVAVAGANAQSISYATTPGDVATYVYTMIDANGIESTASVSVGPLTTPQAVSVPTPSIAAIYDSTSMIIDVTVTPAGGTPNNVTWHLEKSPTSGGAYTEDTTAAYTSPVGTAVVDLQSSQSELSASYVRWLRVRGKVGTVWSSYSTSVMVTIPGAPPPGGGGGGGIKPQ